MIWRNIASNFLSLLVVILIAAAGAVAWAKRQYEGPGPSAVAQCVQVGRNEGLASLSNRLADQGAISSAYIFRAGADYQGKAGSLKYGSYLVPAGASMAEIIDAATKGGPSSCGTEVLFRVGVRANSVVLREIDPATGAYAETAKYDPDSEAPPEAITAAIEEPDSRLRLAVAEGVTSSQVVNAMREASFMSGEVATVPAEGMLAPDTYDVPKGQDRAELLANMEARQADILAKAWETRAGGLPYESPQEALTMASIVEKETAVPDERRVVASVFVNRLEQGMKLQTDPTVIYGITRGEGVLDRGIRQSELRSRTAYNTYVINGLPPTPIANPGRAAIAAALDPEKTDYLFFVADGTGGHVFARTLDEHNANVARWREIEGQQSRN